MDKSWGFQDFDVAKFQDNRHMKVVRLSAQCTDRLYPTQESFLVFISVRDRVYLRAIWRSEGLMSMKNSNDTICNRTHDLPACSAVSQPTAWNMKNESTIGDLPEIRAGELPEVLNFGSALRIINIIMVQYLVLNVKMSVWYAKWCMPLVWKGGFIQVVWRPPFTLQFLFM